MTRRTGPALLAAVAIVIGAAVVGAWAYGAGLAEGAISAGERTATPAYGWHPLGFGFGLFGLLGTVVFFFLLFGLFRALLWRGAGWGRHGGGGKWRTGPWEAYGHEAFDDWHRRAHGTPDPDPVTGRMPDGS